MKLGGEGSQVAVAVQRRTNPLGPLRKAVTVQFMGNTMEGKIELMNSKKVKEWMRPGTRLCSKQLREALPIKDGQSTTTLFVPSVQFTETL